MAWKDLTKTFLTQTFLDRAPPVEWKTDFDQTPLQESGQAEPVPDLNLIKPSMGDSRGLEF